MKYFLKQLIKVPMLLVFVVMIVIFGLGALGKTAEIDQFAVVTAMGIDLAKDETENNYEVSMMTFIPVAQQSFTERYKIVSAKGRSVSEAIDYVGLNIGKQVGLSHLKIIVLAQEVAREDLFKFLDYLTRTTQLSLSTKVVVTHDDSAKAFLSTAQTLDTESSIKVSELITFNSAYIYGTDSSLESFFKGTFGPTKVGLMACLTSQNGQGDSIDSQGGGAGDGGGNASGGPQSEGQQSGGSGSQGGAETGGGSQGGHQTGGQEDNLGITQCHVDVFKNGKFVEALDGQGVKKINLIRGGFTTGSIQVEHLTDKFFNDATVIFEIFGKNESYHVTYENGVPVVFIDLKLTLRLSEVENNGEIVKENVEFFVVTNEAITAVENEVKRGMAEGLEFMREKQVDVADFYTFLFNNNKKAFLKFLDGLEDKENYLSHIVFKAAVKVNVR